LFHYLTLADRAQRARLVGDISVALQYEKSAQEIYDRLPIEYQW